MLCDIMSSDYQHANVDNRANKLPNTLKCVTVRTTAKHNNIKFRTQTQTHGYIKAQNPINHTSH